MVETVSNNNSICKCCKESILQADEFCASCGFPLKGTEEEQGKYIGQYILGTHNISEDENQINKSRKGLLIVAGLLVVGGFWSAKSGGEVAAINLVGNIILAIVFAFITLWSEKNPFAAFITTLLLFLSLQIVAFIINPSSLVSGILLKVVIIALLVNGVVSAAKTKSR